MGDEGDLLSQLTSGEASCPICGAPLKPARGEWECYYCGKKELADFVCTNGHYVCEECRLASGEEIVLKVASRSSEADPSIIADRIFTHPAVDLFGPIHHLVVAASLLAAAKNAGAELSLSHIKRASARLKSIPYAACGLLGACGAAVGAGVSVSVITGATQTSDRERSLAMEATASALRRIAGLGGPRCCKASVYASLEAAVPIIREEIGIPVVLRDLEGACMLSERNGECWGERCPYHPRGRTA